MTINIVCTSKPVDGLLYYSYEYNSYLNSCGIPSRLIIIPHRGFKKNDYLSAINNKYIHCKDVIIDSFTPLENDVTLVMGRSMITISWLNFNDYSPSEQETLVSLFKCKLISVYSENHPRDYPLALDFYSPNFVADLCDTEVYPSGIGTHFEETINFAIHKECKIDKQVEYLFLGTNDKYYDAAVSVINNFPNYGILVYDAPYINKELNNMFAPVDNLLGIFDTYVYTKKTFDPAPRLFQECKYHKKNIIYLRDKNIIDGGSVYWKRSLKDLNIKPIMEAYDKLH